MKTAEERLEAAHFEAVSAVIVLQSTNEHRFVVKLEDIHKARNHLANAQFHLDTILRGESGFN